jgi:hypothetical protein
VLDQPVRVSICFNRSFRRTELPNLLAAGSGFPWRSERKRDSGLRLAALLFAASAPSFRCCRITPTGGDAIALGYVLIALVTTAAILVAKSLASGVIGSSIGDDRRPSPPDAARRRSQRDRNRRPWEYYQVRIAICGGYSRETHEPLFLALQFC